MKPPRPRIVKPRLVWRLIGGNWTPEDYSSQANKRHLSRQAQNRREKE